MPRPATRPGNANKHPGQVVLDVSAEKLAKATALDDAQKQVAAKEDAMAVEQMAQRAGPGRLVRPKPKPRPVTKAVTAPAANPNETPVEANLASRSTDIQKKKYPGLKLTFKDGVNASRKVSNTGVTSLGETRVGSAVDDGKFRKSLASEPSIPSEGVGVGKWARSVASKSQVKPSAPPSAHASIIANNDAEGFEDDDPPEDHDDRVTMSRGGPGVVLIFQTADDAPRGQKRGLSTVLLEDLELEEQREMEEDQDADEDVREDVDMTDQQDDIEASTGPAR
ncbi:hypothetical protein BDR05DRAFT_1003614 [Suillus weaverae]|nr:hypothetical protein BDR05DRAFT_1003614 [Suillus weaverae]